MMFVLTTPDIVFLTILALWILARLVLCLIDLIHTPPRTADDDDGKKEEGK